MQIIQRFDVHPYLKYGFVSYLVLAFVDTVHHLHAALGLGQSNAMHAVWLDLILIPVVVLLLVCFLYSGRKYFYWGYSVIVVLAILIPGLYHGGWHHLGKTIRFIFVEGESTDIKLLYPSDNVHFWFYEITGALEFILAVLAGIYWYKSLRAQL